MKKSPYKKSCQKPCPRCPKLLARVAQLERLIQDLQQERQAAERHRLGLPPEGNSVTAAMAELHQAQLQVAVAMRLAPAGELPEVATSRLSEEHRLQMGDRLQELVGEAFPLIRLASRNRSSKRVARVRAAR